MEDQIKKYLEHTQKKRRDYKSFREKKIGENPFCHYCKEKMKLYDGYLMRNLKKGERFPDDMATVEHLFDRFDMENRYKIYENDEDKVLACYKCNSERARERTKKIPRSLMTERARLAKAYKKTNPGKPKIFAYIENTQKIGRAI